MLPTVEGMKRIFLTGAAGLVGGEVAKRLLSRGHSITALLNRSREIRSNDGKTISCSSFDGGSPPPGSLAAISGDLGQDRLGWSPGLWSQVAAAHDLVVHCAALTQFDADEARYRSVNVDGTARIIELAEAGGMQLLHVSTAYVCGLRAGPVLEAELDCGQAFANGYEASKAAAERLVRGSSVAAVAARPSIVVGHSVTGAVRSFDSLYGAFKLVAEGRIRFMPASPGATLDFVPIDYVAAGIVALAEGMDGAAGETVHLVSGAPVSVEQFRDTIAAYKQFTAPTLIDPDRFDIDALPALERRVHRRIAGLYASYFQRRPEFVDDRFRALTGMACSSTGPVFLRRLIDHCISVGFLAANRVPASEAD